MDFTTMTDDELEQLRIGALTERERRVTIETAEAQADLLNERYVRAIGRIDGDDWTQPVGAHDAYREGAVVSHGGKTWVSTTPANVWEPGVSGWREQATVDPETGDETIPNWVQPTGGHDAYKKGDQVTYQGDVWESLIDGNSWSPTDYPQGWTRVDA